MNRWNRTRLIAAAGAALLGSALLARYGQLSARTIIELLACATACVPLLLLWRATRSLRAGEETRIRLEREKEAILNGIAGMRIKVVDRDMRIIRCSHAVCAECAPRRESLTGRFCYEAVRGRNSPCPNCATRKALETGRCFQEEVSTGDGTTGLAYTNPVRDENGAVIGAVRVVLDITERKRAEAMLQEREARLRSIIENAAEVIYTLSPQGVVTYVSPVWTDKLGWEPGDLEGKGFASFIHPDDLAACRGALERILAVGKRGRGVEYRIRHRDGSWRWHRSAGSLVKDHEGKPLYIIGIAEDITESSLARERQARSLERLEGINRLQEQLILPGPLAEKFKKIADAGVSLLGLDFCRIWRMLPADLCDAGCVLGAAADSVPRCRRDRCLHLAASSGRYTHIDGDHARVPLGLYKIGQIASGEDKKFLTNSATTDPQVHDHPWAERLGLVSFAGYKLQDARGKVTGVLAAFARHPLSEEDDAFLSHLADTTSKVIMDHMAEEELRQAQKMEGVGQLAGGVAHEFNNLLQVIDGYTCSGMEGLDPDEERYADLEQVRKAAERATVLTRQLLGFSRRRAVEPRNTDANLLVRDLVKLIRPAIGAHISLELALGADVGTVYADAGALQQALLNLCVNARDAMPSGGTLVLRTETVVLAEPFWDPHFDLKPGRYVVFSVSDTGCGIPRDIQPHIFEPFFTTKEVGKGTGLGLALVYGVVRQHQGAIHVYSEVGMGTTVKLYLPPGGSAAEQHRVEEACPAHRGHETILVAEDDPAVRKLSVRALRRAGYTVLAAADGEEALRTFQARRGEIALVLLDAIMPKLTGNAVHRRIQEMAPGTKIICCTGYDRETARSDCLACESLPVVQKPFTDRTLLFAVREALDTPSPCLQAAHTTN
jgi:PAS domain S-box-containing protein